MGARDMSLLKIILSPIFVILWFVRILFSNNGAAQASLGSASPPIIIPDNIDVVVKGMRRRGSTWTIKIGTRGQNWSTTEHYVTQNITRSFNGSANGISFTATVDW